MDRNTRAGFDKNINSFSPEGRLYQIEYAIKSSKNSGTTCIAIKGRNTVCMIEENKKSLYQTTVELDSISFKLNNFLGCVCSGIPGDLSYLKSEIIQEYCSFYEKNGFDITIEHLTNLMAIKNQVLTQQSFTRILAVNTIFFGIDNETGPVVLKLDPSGYFSSCSISVIGEKENEFKSYILKNNFFPDIKFYDYEKTVTFTISLLQHVLKNDLKAIDMKITVISEEKKFQILSLKEIYYYLERLKKINQNIKSDN
jgi:20S proteasome subunit alpha 1